MSGVVAGGVVNGYPAARDRLDRGRPKVGVAARDDAVEISEVGRQIERESVADHRAVELDADRGQLFALAPDAGQTGAGRRRTTGQASW